MLYILATLITFVLTLIIIIFLYFKWSFSYWKRRNVPFLEPTIPYGSSENPFRRKEFIGHRMKKRYDELKSLGLKHGGLYMFTSPTYLPIDPEYIKNILQRDFHHFTDHGIYYNEKDDPLSANLFNLEGDKWKSLRTKITPTFTSGKMKMMLPIVIECSKQLVDAMSEYYHKGEPVEMKDVLSCFTTDVIGSCAFGLDCNSFKNPNSKFKNYAQQIFVRITKSNTFPQVISMAFPNLARLLGITSTPKDISDFFINTIKETIKYRKETNIIRQDFLQILIDLQESDKPITFEEITAQAYIFFLAGYETSSSAMSFCLFEMSLNSDIQEKARKEIINVLKNGEITYEAIMDLKYLDHVISETLRKYPPAPLIPRTCVKDYNVPGTNIIIEKGTRVLIPIFALHYDPEYFSNPETFNPDRFAEENVNKIHPFTYLPFGEGPRMCIGLRFALMQIKVGLANLLLNYRFTISDKTKVPLEIENTNMVLQVKGGIWLDLEKICD